MGLFKKIKKGVKKVVGGVVKGVTKVFDAVGIDLAKIMDNKWVKGAMLATAIFTGGVAIANGVMSGFASATAAQAAQTAVTSTAQGFMNTFVAGAKGFIEGVATGLANPLDTAGDLFSQAKTALGGAADVAGAAGGAVDQTAAQAMNAGGPPPGINEASGALPNMPLEPNRPDFMALPQEAAAGQAANPSAYGFSDMADMGTDALSGQIAKGEQGFLSSMASGAKDFITSPAGMMTGANAIQGWAQGQMVEERWDQMEKKEKDRRDSWRNFDTSAQDYNIPSLQNLRERTSQLRARGNQAQAKYGY